MKNEWLQLFFHLAFIAGFICFMILFYFDIKNIFLTYYIIIMSFILLISKLLYWYKSNNYIVGINKEKIFFQRLTICLFTYISPAYCILQEPYLIINRYISLLSFIIVTLLAITGIIMEIKLNLKISRKFL